MHDRLHRLRGRGVWAALMALLCASLPVLSVRADNDSGTVLIHGTIPSQTGITGCGAAGLVKVLQHGRKQEWYYVYAVDAGTAGEGRITVNSNDPWSGVVVASPSLANRRPRGVPAGPIRLASAAPATYGQANDAPILGVALLALFHPPGVTVSTHYYLVHVRQPAAPVAVTLTYGIGPFPFVFSSMCQVTIAHAP